MTIESKIWQLAEQVFGNPQKAERWLRKPKRLLNGRSPVDVLDSKDGAEQVTEMLYRIDEGMGG